MPMAGSCSPTCARASTLCRAEHEGFSPRQLHFALQPREIKILRLSLEINRVEVSLRVTADAPAIASTHSPSSTLLSTERLDATSVTQRHSLTDAIVTLAPGMIRGHDDFVHIRGHEIALNPSINGVSFWENPHAVFSAGLSAEIIDTANVMTGGFSAEYGNRFGGVVDIITKSGLVLGNSGTVTINIGESGRRNLSGEIAGRRGSFGYYIFGSAFESDRFLSPPDVMAIHDSAHAGRVFAQIDQTLESAGSLRVVLMLDGTNFQIPKSPLDVTMRPLANATQRNRQQSAIAGWTGSVSNLAVSASFYQRWSRSQLFPASGPLTATARLSRELATIGGKVDVTRFAGRHAVKMGLDAVSLRPEETSRTTPPATFVTRTSSISHIFTSRRRTSNIPGASRAASSAAYVRDAIQIGGATADIGARLDRYELVVSALHVSPARQCGRSGGQGRNAAPLL